MQGLWQRGPSQQRRYTEPLWALANKRGAPSKVKESQSHGVVGKVNITNDTYKLIKDDAQFSFESRGKVVVKGKGEIEMWFVSLKNGNNDH